MLTRKTAAYGNVIVGRWQPLRRKHVPSPSRLRFLQVAIASLMIFSNSLKVRGRLSRVDRVGVATPMPELPHF
jgi:hypothetical protein